jgi:hypothetical protein
MSTFVFIVEAEPGSVPELDSFIDKFDDFLYGEKLSGQDGALTSGLVITSKEYLGGFYRGPRLSAGFMRRFWKDKPNG